LQYEHFLNINPNIGKERLYSFPFPYVFYVRYRTEHFYVCWIVYDSSAVCRSVI